MARTVVNVTASSTLDGRDISADGTKLDGIEANATADQTAAEIKSLVEASSDIALAGNPTTTTQSSGNSSTRIATTAFVADATSGLATDSNLNSKAPIASPTFTGVPAAPTASSGTNTTQLATTAFVTTAVAGATIDGISSSADATAITIDSSENVGIGESSPTSKLHVRGTSGAGSRVHIRSEGAGLTSFDGSGSGLLLTANGMNVTSKFTPAIQFGTTDPSFTTTNPKVGAAINGVAAQTYSADDRGGMELAFYTTSNDPGTGQTTTERMRIDNDGRVGIGTASPKDYHSLSQFVVAQSGDAGITIASGTSNDGRIFFADGTSGSAESEGTIRYDHSNNSMFFSTSDSVRLRIDSDGVKFGTDSAATNALDDYEEGTWTPAYGVSTGSFGSITHSLQNGYYTKVGNVCTAAGRLDTSAMSIGTASNYLFITGFPFASKTGAYQSGVISYSYGYSSVWANAIAFQGSTNYVYLFSIDDGANSSTIGPSNLGTGQTYLYFTITYLTN